MCEVMCVSMFIIWLIVGRAESAILFAAVGFAVAGGLYRIGRGIENAGKKEDGKSDESGVA